MGPVIDVGVAAVTVIGQSLHQRVIQVAYTTDKPKSELVLVCE
jgi:hypothetical protein